MTQDKDDPKVIARWKVRNALNQGKLIRPDLCQKCGKSSEVASNGRSTIEAHHYKGYDFPLEVEWLCIKCHNIVDPAPSGEEAAPAKLTWEDVEEIRRRYVPRPMGNAANYQCMQPNSLPSLALEFGVFPSTIHRIITRRTWNKNEQH